MQLYYALYDPATPTSDGHYWTWHADELSLKILNRFYDDIAVKHFPPEPNKLNNDDLWGGIARFNFPDKNNQQNNAPPQWTVLYRYFNGGYDRQDRPGRYVIFTIWMRTNETNGIDLSPLFESPIIKKIAEVSQKLPVPQPSVLSRVWEGKKAQILNINLNIKMSENGGKFPLTNKDAALKAPLYFANIPLERIVSVKIVNTTTTQESVLEVKPLLLPSQLPPSPKEEKISIDLPDTKSVSVYKAEDSIQQEKIMNRNNYFQSEYKPKQVKKFPIIALLCGIILGLIWGLILGVALERITAISENLIMRQENFEIPKGEQPQSQKNQSHTIELKNSEKQKKTNNINVGKK